MCIRDRQLDGDVTVQEKDESLPLREWLATRKELTRLSRPFLASHAAQSRSDELNDLLAPTRSADFATLLGLSLIHI